ncbi:failed axon connections homolog isoform X1 [Eriocheir sinensis]|uniref:failed axon connections homolog isoform X1 n=2 Tax=Eriocheir sinensis TaxID=95602 RepID=UPI0021C6375A|nr:failed axon connections homolog isoform X1 [Eriocheir sinensis]
MDGPQNIEVMDIKFSMQAVAEVLWPETWQGRACTLAAGVFALIVTKKVLKGAKARRLRKEWDSVGQDVVLLHQFQRGKFCPNLSPFALKVEVFLRLANIQYKVDEKSPFGPKRKCPWITINGEDIADSEFILEDLTQRFNVQMDSQLEDREAAVLEAARVLADEHLFWCVIIWRYWLDGCITFLKTQTYSKVMNWIFTLFMKNGIRKRAKEQGMGRHSPEDIYQICKKDCATLAGILGNKLFFGGEEPCRADCAVFGQLSQLMWNAPNTRYEALVTEVYPNLSSYCLRMKEKVFPDWNDLLVGSE